MANESQWLPDAPVVEVGGQRQWVLAWWTQLLYALLFGSVVAVAVVGNALVVWAVLAHRSMRTTTNCFLVNLSLADAMTATFNAVFNLVYMLESHWAFGLPYCVFSNFLANLTLASSSFTITAMSVDRYFAIVRPLCGRPRRRRSVVTLCAVWSGSALLSLPTLLYSRTRSYRYGDHSVRTVCLLVWPDGRLHGSFADYVYNILFLVLTYAVPVATMVVTYSRMSWVLWGSRCIGEFTEHQQLALRNKQKVVKMLMTVVILFTVSWLPYHAYFIYLFHHPGAAYADCIQHVYLAMYWLAMAHTTYNPIVYYCMNQRFKRYFRRFLCFCVRSLEPGDERQYSLAHSRCSVASRTRSLQQGTKTKSGDATTVNHVRICRSVPLSIPTTECTSVHM
ncbi:tachykinin-like peptides receptor 86C [Dermacentor silvarum]|uniref:tachykinin-like peptides receptor 86C n=1 Tax=Dermacentor silvarum TaxID=543639 RepID=UPI001899CBBF|nr:tachykinin-like peptides receptor 86C [Dermacentor silvarum]